MKPKKIKAVKTYGYGILNKFEDFWTNQVFLLPEEAQSYVDEKQKEWDLDLSKHKIIPVKITPLTKK